MEPQRRCASCRVRQAKRGLLRFARAPGSCVVTLDPGQRRPGRGAYVCPNLQCAERGLGRGGVARTLRVAIPPEESARLLAAAVEYLRERSNGGARPLERSAGIRRSGIPEEEA